MPQVPIRSLLKVLTITLIMHVCSTGMRFTATLDAINSGASTFWVGAMLASISLGPMCFAIPSGRWLDRGGPRGPLAGARIGMMLAGSSVLLFPAAQYGIASLFAAATLTGFSFMLSRMLSFSGSRATLVPQKPGSLLLRHFLSPQPPATSPLR